MRRAALLLVLLMVATTSLTGYALAEEDEGYPDGHEEWRVDDLMRLYVEGLNQEEAVLQRNSTDGAVGYSRCSEALVKCRCSASRHPLWSTPSKPR